MVNDQILIKQKIVALENQFDVDKWVVNGIYVWPYIRIKLYFLLLKNYNLEPNNNNIRQNIANKNVVRWFASLKKILGIFFMFLRVEFFFLSLKKKKVIFFGAHFHRVKHGSQYFNRFFDSMVSCHSLENEVYMMEYMKVYPCNYNQKAIIPLAKILEDYKLVTKLKSKLKKQRKSYLLANYDSFLNVLESEIENAKCLNITIYDLVKWSNKVENLSSFYTRFYSKTQPSKVVFPGYFGLDNLYAAVFAANMKKIKTIDFQHGTQSNVHMVFSSWTKIPKVGFNLMPKEYWSWDEKSKEYIDDWAKTTPNVNTKVVGQPYLQYWKQKSENLKPQDKVVLYTLNLMPLAEMLNNVLGELMNSLEVLWILRLHPRNEYSVNEIVNYLDSLGIDKCKYQIHDAKDVPLPEIISKTAIHITAFSGALIEAKMMGIPSIIIDPQGKEIYKDYIDNDLVYYLDKENTSFTFDFLNLYSKIKGTRNETECLNIVNPVLE